MRAISSLDSFQKNLQHPNILPEEYVTDMGVAFVGSPTIPFNKRAGGREKGNLRC